MASTVTGVNVRPGEAVTACFPGSRRLWGPAAVWVRSAEHILGRCSRGWRRTALKGTSWELLPLGPQGEGAFAMARPCGGHFQRDTSGQKALGCSSGICVRVL